jgi:hypothetical protein
MKTFAAGSVLVLKPARETVFWGGDQRIIGERGRKQSAKKVRLL